MKTPEGEPTVVGAGFRYWSGDLHHAEVVLRTAGDRVPALLRERRGDGTVVLDVPEGVEDLRDGGRLSLLFRVDERRGGRREQVAPVVTGDYSVDHEAGRVLARFVVDPAVERHPLLEEPVAGTLESPLLFQRRRAMRVVRLSTYGGELVVDDPGTTFLPGMVVTLTLWSPWLGTLRLRAQLTGYREELVGRLTFRVLDRASTQAAAMVLVGTVPGFGFEHLQAASVSPQRMTRYLTVRTVSDDASFRQALELRLLANRSFGRLAAVDDSVAVADHLDPHAVTFVVQLGDKVVGTGRLVVNNGDRALSEIENETDGLPDHIWSRGFVEVSRVAVHPDFRSAGVIVALFREVARLAFVLGCEYLVLDAIAKLAPAYERIGAKRLPIEKTHPYSHEKVQVMAIEVGEQLGHIDRRSVSWQYVFGPVLRHHLATTATRPLDGFVRGAGRVPYQIKKMLSRIS